MRDISQGAPTGRGGALPVSACPSSSDARRHRGFGFSFAAPEDDRLRIGARVLDPCSLARGAFCSS